MGVKDFRGEDNYFRNAVLNCIEVLKKFKTENNREIRNFYEEDVLIPNPPCFVVLVEGSRDELRASQALTVMKYTVNINLTIWYYYGDLTEETKRNEITYVLWEISDLLKRNVTLNGFVPKLGIEVTGVRWMPRPRGNRILSGGTISVLAKKLYRTDNAQ
jgi:hypothetical protein